MPRIRPPAIAPRHPAGLFCRAVALKLSLTLFPPLALIVFEWSKQFETDSTGKNIVKHSQRNLLAGWLAICGLAFVGNVQAQGKLNDINIVTVAFKLQLQSAGINSQNGAVRVFGKPVAQSISTKNLLDRLALDKQAQSLYNFSTFPAGSKLALSAGHFVVVRGNNDFVVDVSDIITFTGGTNDILTGTTNNATGLADSKTTELVLVSLKFDDTFITGGSNLRFFAQGLDTIKTQDSKPGNNGNYNEKTSDSVKDTAGEGQSAGTPFVIAGSIQGNRNVSLNILPPAT